MADLFVSLVSIAQVGDVGDKPVPGTTPQVKRTFSAGRRSFFGGTLPPAPALGHLLDSNTVALWRFDQIGSGSSGVIPDETGNYPLTNNGAYWDPSLGAYGVAPRDAQIGTGAYRGTFPFTGSLPLLSAAAPTAVTDLAGEMTLEFWIAQHVASNSDNILSLRSSSLTVIEVTVAGNGGIGVFWNGVGGTVNTGSTTSLRPGLGVPFALRLTTAMTHVAVRRRFTGGAWLIDVFSDGAFRRTLSRTGFDVPLYTPGAFTGGPYAFRLTSGGQNANDVLNGVLDDVRISKVARTDEEILESYQRGFPEGFVPIDGNGVGHAIDANTLGMWRLDETDSASAALDSSTNALDLPAKTGLVVIVPPQVKPGRIGGARECSGTNGFNAHPAGTPGENIVAALVAGNVDGGGYTYESWIWWNAGPTDNKLFSVHEEVTGLTTYDRGPRYSRLYIRGDSSILVEEWGSSFDGFTLTIRDTGNNGPPIPHNGWIHIALVHRTVGGSVFVDKFLNGGSKVTLGPFVKMAAVGAGPSEGLNVGLGYLHFTNDGSGHAGAHSFNGYIDDFRFSNCIRSDAEILESYNKGKVVPRAPALALLNELISYWKLDTDSNDSVGVANGADTAVTYLGGNAKLGAGGGGFNGTTSKIDLPPAAVSPSTHITVSAWVKTSSSGSYTEFFTNYSNISSAFAGFRFRKSNTNKLEFYVGRNVPGSVLGVDHVGAVSTASINTGAFVHVVGTYDGTHVRTYVNGVISGFPVFYTGGIVYAGLQYARIGCVSVAGSEAGVLFWNGAIDEVGLWSRALSASEVSSLYNGGAGLTYPF